MVPVNTDWGGALTTVRQTKKKTSVIIEIFNGLRSEALDKLVRTSSNFPSQDTKISIETEQSDQNVLKQANKIGRLPTTVRV